MSRNILADFLKDDFWLENVEAEKEKAVSIIREPEEIEDAITPHGYVELFLDGIEEDELQNVHNVILKSVTKNNKKYISSILLLNIPKELDCYSEGENKNIIIRKIDSTMMCIIALDINNVEDKVYVHKGKIEFRV